MTIEIIYLVFLNFWYVIIYGENCPLLLDFPIFRVQDFFKYDLMIPGCLCYVLFMSPFPFCIC